MRGIYHIVAQAYKFLVDRSPCPVLSTIKSQLVTIFKSVATSIFLQHCKWMTVAQ